MDLHCVHCAICHLASPLVGKMDLLGIPKDMRMSLMLTAANCFSLQATALVRVTHAEVLISAFSDILAKFIILNTTLLIIRYHFECYGLGYGLLRFVLSEKKISIKIV